MSDASARTWVAFNGEVYNFRELRAQLEAKGRTFRTSGDTEVVLAAWLEWGPDAVSRLDGMFAIAIWDEQAKSLLLARDRTGKKPLFVYEDGRKLLFASEMKALLAHPDVDTRENPEAIPQFLSHGYVPSPATFYARIRSVAPATWELHGPSGLARQATYWDFPLGPERPLASRDAVAEAEATVRDLFFKAVKRRMVADVPVGAFLSGGIDSTLVVAAMAHHSSRPVKTFSIGFEGYPEWDETRYARIVADRYGTEHTEFKVSPESFDLLEKLVWHFDVPFGDASCIPTYVVSKLTRQHVTVALTGDGGDEVFAGYSRFLAASLGERMPQLARRVARRVIPLLPQSERHHGPWERGRRLALALSREMPERLRSWMTFFTLSELNELLVPEVARYANDIFLGESYARHVHHARDRGADVVNQLLYANTRTYLLDDLNVKTDRASMAVGLETRSPFLDTALMEFAFSMPGHAKLRGKTTKWLLKRSMRDLIPPEILIRPKMGFGVPIGAWFKTDRAGELARPWHEGLLRVVRPEALRRLTAHHQAGGRDLGPQVFLVKMLESFLAGSARPKPLAAGSA